MAAHHGMLSDEDSVPKERPEPDLSAFCSLTAFSTITVSFYCFISAICLVGSATFVNVYHKLFSDDAVHAAVGCGVNATSWTVNRARNVLIGASITFILIYTIFALAAVWYIRRTLMDLERSMCQLYCTFDHLSKLRLESVPLYVNKYSDVDVITEKHTFLLERYSNVLELQQTEDSINNVSLILRQFRKLLPDAVFHKKIAGELRESMAGEMAILRTVGNRPSNRLGTMMVAKISSLLRRQNIVSPVAPDGKQGLACPTEFPKTYSSVLQEDINNHGKGKCSCGTLNIAELQSGIDFCLKKRMVTVVVASLSGLAVCMDEDLQYFQYFSQEFLSVVTDLIDRNNGTVLNAAPDRVTAVWNAFSATPDHERAGMQCVCESIFTLESLFAKVFIPMGLELTPVVVATSGCVLAGTVGSEDERAMVVHGRCVSLGEALPSLLMAQGVKYACTGTLFENCSELFTCVPIEYVTDVDERRHVIYEIVNKPVPSLQRITEAFKRFQAGEYDLAERMYLKLSRENCEDRWGLRMGQLCSYLARSGGTYQRRVPQWQMFPVEETDDSTVTQRNKLFYHWRKPEVTPVEDQLRNAILRNSGTCTELAVPPCGVIQPRPNFFVSGDHVLSFPPLSEAPKPPAVFDVCDRQGMTFRMSDRILGTGVSGIVSMGLSQTGALVAIKAIQLPRITHTAFNQMSGVNRRRLRRKGINVDVNVDEALDTVINEVSLLSRLRHANIVGYISCAILRDKLLVVMEFASGGSLYNMLHKFTKFKVDQAKRYLRDVLKGLVYLHREDIVHRDIKPQNVLLLETGLCKLSDFGTSKCLLKVCNSGQPEGTPPYIAPEAARGRAEKASDIWSFGIMMAQMLSGRLPWSNMEEMTPQTFCYNVGHNENFVPQLDEQISAQEKEIIMRCCNRVPSKRPTAEELLQDPYFSQSKTFTNAHPLGSLTSRVDECFQLSSLNASQLRPSSERPSTPSSS
ncbi:putative serine/threonine protein kinase [Trypanosoma cruzi]|uniref:Putative serine/threonine protein kinase n=1 Tax=Trypanosoma cruzi TaxID=5693 RepID=A0A2V2VX41_TRYCR|nr:putative serine/threonine protein kinase [Trypanosoma cruzi]